MRTLFIKILLLGQGSGGKPFGPTWKTDLTGTYTTTVVVCIGDYKIRTCETDLGRATICSYLFVIVDIQPYFVV
ncbi:hypothetical protein F5Y10DRAFT_254935 [Nemania abortiva]|nr:hypothetical protein F5Y10DRAFT_254935 [Nemania abortiva]